MRRSRSSSGSYSSEVAAVDFLDCHCATNSQMEREEWQALVYGDEAATPVRIA